MTIDDLSKAIVISPKSPELYNNRGVAYSFLKQYKRSIHDFHQAISLDSDHINAYLNRGASYSNLGDCREIEKAKAEDMCH